MGVLVFPSLFFRNCFSNLGCPGLFQNHVLSIEIARRDMAAERRANTNIMIIQSFTAANGPFQSPFAIAPETVDSEQGHITVMIGENGVRKSLVLRILMDAALGKRTHKGHGHKPIPITVAYFGNEPGKVIAVSQTPWDRFPRSLALSELETSIPWFNDRFVYVGARSRAGIISTRYNEATFGLAMLENRWSFEQRGDALSPIFERLGLSTAVGIRFAPLWKAQRLPGGDISEQSIEVLQKVLTQRLKDIERNSDISRNWKHSIAEFVQEFSTTESGLSSLWRTLEESTSQRIACWIKPEGTNFSLGFESIEKWRSAIYLGLFKVTGVFFAARGDKLPVLSKEAVRESHLSSGQWSWLYNLATLCVELDDNSLVLIDEPENSLHPSWQRDFVSSLSAILRCCVGCHAVVATHSALIASGVRDGLGNVRRLVLSGADGNTISEAPKVDAYGAQVDDVYRELFDLESTRTPEFVARVDDLLARIRDARGERPVVAEEDIAYILSACEHLPSHDPMRSILNAIAESVISGARDQ